MIPADLHARLAERAKQEYVSINSFLLILIEKATKEPKKR